MTDKIEYSFLLSKSVCEELDDISRMLRQNTADAEKDNLGMLSRAWRSEASERYTGKYTGLLTTQKTIADEIEAESEKIRALSRRLYLIEEAAKKTVSEKGS